MNSVKSSYICLACLIVGIALQVFSFTDMCSHPVAMCLGGLLLSILAPILGKLGQSKTPAFTGGLSEQPGTKKWKTIGLDKLNDVYAVQTSISNKKSFLDYFLTIGTDTGGIIFSVIMPVFALPFCIAWCSNKGINVDFVAILQIIILFWQHIFIRRAIFFMLYGKAAAQVFKKTRPPVEKKFEVISPILNGIANRPVAFQLQPQVELRAEPNGCAMLTDIRFNMKFDAPVPGLLCGMVCMSVNRVQQERYPYAYLVYVFQGAEHANRRGISLHEGIENILTANSDIFSFSTQIQDGNSIFVITKASYTDRAYVTSPADCDVLMNVAKDIADFFEYKNDFLKQIAY